MELRSTAYRPGGAIPARHACDGENLSPDFTWSDVPSQTKSLALVLHDPDAPKAGGFTHWVLYDIAPETRQIDAGVPKQEPVTDFGLQGKNDGGRIGYMGPCPPSGTHHYIARLYALDTEVDLKPGATRRELERVMQGHILDQAALTGTYARSAKTTRGRVRAEVAA
jgi:Raf kinase inhibitor-like YbhB/YbcL family protein